MELRVLVRLPTALQRVLALLERRQLQSVAAILVAVIANTPDAE